MCHGRGRTEDAIEVQIRARARPGGTASPDSMRREGSRTALQQQRAGSPQARQSGGGGCLGGRGRRLGGRGRLSRGRGRDRGDRCLGRGGGRCSRGGRLGRSGDLGRGRRQCGGRGGRGRRGGDWDWDGGAVEAGQGLGPGVVTTLAPAARASLSPCSKWTPPYWRDSPAWLAAYWKLSTTA
jgi:hypothetical protein